MKGDKIFLVESLESANPQHILWQKLFKVQDNKRNKNNYRVTN